MAPAYPYDAGMEPIHPTLLRRPNPGGIPSIVEDVIPGDPWDYFILQVGDAWSVKHQPSGKEVYAGVGPVEVLRSPAPF